MTRARLETRWLALTREILPRMASERRWPVSADHCFQRILLDNATGGVWYHAIPGRPAYRAATDAQLAAAVGLAERAITGESDLASLNTQSLAWRRKT